MSTIPLARRALVRVTSTTFAVITAVTLALPTAAFATVAREPGGAVTRDPGGAVRGKGDKYKAVITRTDGGVPHISGDSYADVTFGQGWASGEDRSCDLADQVVKIRGERARWLGPGEGNKNVDSDIAWKVIGIFDRASKDFEHASRRTVESFDAFAAGWNAHLHDVGVGGLSGWCAGASWVRAIEPVEVYAYYRSVALRASSGAVVNYIPHAQPPTDVSATPAPAAAPSAPAMASNGWAIGADRSADGGGLLLANPHFPWEGERRLWESHLTVPGELDIYGGQLSGLPGIGIGFTEGVRLDPHHRRRATASPPTASRSSPARPPPTCTATSNAR